MLVTIDKSLILNVYVRPIKVVSVDNIVRTIIFTIPVKRDRYFPKIYTKFKFLVFRTKSLNSKL